METAALPNKHLPNLPQQRRGIERFEAILDHAEPLLSGKQGAEASIYDIAEVAGLPTRSVYRLFPSMAALRFALGQRYMNEIAQMVENLDYSTCASWQEAAELGLLEGRRYYELHPFALELILGAEPGWELLPFQEQSVAVVRKREYPG